ncbi:hypothetical protein LguiA_013652 [Lonicera macranthoides]
MCQWSKLPGDLLDTIDENLVMYSDKVRVRAVCDSWNSHLQKIPNHRLRQLPWLLQAFKNNKKASHGLFNLLEEQFYLLDLPAEAQGILFIGSSHGWVLTIQDLDINNRALDICLINPLTRAVIQLPPRLAFPDVVEYCVDNVGEEYAMVSDSNDAEGMRDGIHVHFISQIHLLCLIGKIILSSPPSYDDCVVVAIYGEKPRLAYCKCNDKKWMPLMEDNFIAYSDIIFYKRKLYALTAQGRLLFFENISPESKAIEIVSEGPPGRRCFPMYLVECSDGGLLMVCRYVDFFDGEHKDSIVRTIGFGVYKLDQGNSSWIKVKDIGEDMLFLGCNSSMSMSSRNFPGYKGNRIYFTDSPFSYSGKENEQENSDIGVFNLEDGSFEPPSGFKCDPKFLWPPPIWVTPPGPY